MPVPKATMDEYYFLIPDKDYIGMAGKVAAMQGITITHSMNNGTDNYFRRSVLGPDLRHIERSLFPCMHIRHKYHVSFLISIYKFFHTHRAPVVISDRE